MRVHNMRLTSFLLIFLVVSRFASVTVIAVSNDEVDGSLKKAIANLYSLQHDGNWETVPAPVPRPEGHTSTEDGQWGGLTALATYALLSAGEKASDPRLHSAISFLYSAKLRGVYAIAIRSQIYSLLPTSPELVKSARRDAKLLLDSMKMKGIARGQWSYFVDSPTDDRNDRSLTQFAVLGLWACAEAGVELPDKFWQLENTVWREQQSQDGGWSYAYLGARDNGKPTMTMTCAGLSTLFLVQDQLKGSQTACNGNAKDDSMDKALEWVGSQFPKNFGALPDNAVNYPPGGGRTMYLLYGLQRLGIYSGRRYFNNIDWFQAGANYLVGTQAKDGSWGPQSYDTSFAILFMARGRSPIGVNKLNYSAGRKQEAPWNQRPRDLAGLTHWLGKQLEIRLNWQTVDITTDPNDWLDAPILYICGNEELNFSEEQVVKLRQYVSSGGLIVGNADCGSVKFASSFKKLGTALFQEEFRELPSDHIIYTQAFTNRKWKQKPNVLGLSNEVREMMLLFSDADPSKAWQLQNLSRLELFEVMGNIYLYAVGDSSTRYRGKTFTILPDASIKDVQDLRLARLQYEGNWDPEPSGWTRFSADLHNRQKVRLLIQNVKLGDGKLDANFHLAHLTGTQEFRLSTAAGQDLRQFVDKGGIVLIDSAGGNTRFTAAAESELAKLFPDDKLVDVPVESILYTKPNDIRKIEYRRFARKTVGATDAPRLKAIVRNGRYVVIFSSLDVSAGLVGINVDGVTGYSPTSALNLASNVAAYSISTATNRSEK